MNLFGPIGADVRHGGTDNDNLQGWSGNDVFFGGDGDDILVSRGGNDTLDGGHGDDIMNGGNGDDVFVFSNEFGHDVIEDFEANNSSEKIDLSDVSSITNYADLSANHLTQSGSNVIIDAGGGNTIELSGVNLGDLGSDDFIF